MVREPMKPSAASKHAPLMRPCDRLDKRSDSSVTFRVSLRAIRGAAQGSTSGATHKRARSLRLVASGTIRYNEDAKGYTEDVKGYNEDVKGYAARLARPAPSRLLCRAVTARGSLRKTSRKPERGECAERLGAFGAVNSQCGVVNSIAAGLAFRDPIRQLSGLIVAASTRAA
eukprot:6621374-Pyramimonas_sp.AAC.1